MIIAAPRPISARIPISWPLDCENAASRLAPANTTSPVCSSRLRPMRSPSEPITSSSPAKTSTYESIIHCSSEALASNSRCSVGMATFSTVLSIPMMTRLSDSTASVNQRSRYLSSLEMAMVPPPGGASLRGGYERTDARGHRETRRMRPLTRLSRRRKP